MQNLYFLRTTGLDGEPVIKIGVSQHWFRRKTSIEYQIKREVEIIALFPTDLGTYEWKLHKILEDYRCKYWGREWFAEEEALTVLGWLLLYKKPIFSSVEPRDNSNKTLWDRFRIVFNGAFDIPKFEKISIYDKREIRGVPFYSCENFMLLGASFPGLFWEFDHVYCVFFPDWYRLEYDHLMPYHTVFCEAIEVPDTFMSAMVGCSMLYGESENKYEYNRRMSEILKQTVEIERQVSKAKEVLSSPVVAMLNSINCKTKSERNS